MEPGENPDKRGKANATSISKWGQKVNLGNNSPVSLTLVAGKIVEQVLWKCIFGHIEEKVTGNTQDRFSKNKSWLTKTIAFYENKTWFADKGSPANVIYLLARVQMLSPTIFFYPS